MKPIKQTPIRDRVYRELLKLILRGELPPGSKVKDSDLAGRFVVSRTPVRESLLRLEREGFVENHMGRGFEVRPLTRKEVEEIYPILWTLEAFALEKSSTLPQAALSRLEALSGRMKGKKTSPMDCIDLDAGWHAALLSSCRNEQLLKTIESLRVRIRRYEHAYMQNARLIENSISDHEAVKALLENEQKQEAASFLKKHWKRSLDFLLDRLGREEIA